MAHFQDFQPSSCRNLCICPPLGRCHPSWRSQFSASASTRRLKCSYRPSADNVRMTLSSFHFCFLPSCALILVPIASYHLRLGLNMNDFGCVTRIPGDSYYAQITMKVSSNPTMGVGSSFRTFVTRQDGYLSGLRPSLTSVGDAA